MRTFYFGRYGEINSEYLVDTLIIDAVSDDVNINTSNTVGAQIDFKGLACSDSKDLSYLIGTYWNTTDLLVRYETSASYLFFTRDLAVKEVAETVNLVLDSLHESQIFSSDELPNIFSLYSNLGAIDSSAITFLLLNDSLNSDPGTQGFGSCALLALGATGAIVGVLSNNPALGIACGSSCGGALTCLSTLVGGGTLTISCGSVIGGCLTCVGLGYVGNFQECFRHFTEEE